MKWAFSLCWIVVLVLASCAHTVSQNEVGFTIPAPEKNESGYFCVFSQFGWDGKKAVLIEPCSWDGDAPLTTNALLEQASDRGCYLLPIPEEYRKRAELCVDPDGESMTISMEMITKSGSGVVGIINERLCRNSDMGLTASMNGVRRHFDFCHDSEVKKLL